MINVLSVASDLTLFRRAVQVLRKQLGRGESFLIRRGGVRTTLTSENRICNLKEYIINILYQ